MLLAIWDGLVCGTFVIALIALTSSLYHPAPLTEQGLKNYNLEVLGLSSDSNWEDINQLVNSKSKEAARSSLIGANIPNLSMQSKHQQNSWPALGDIDQG